jgi:Domain of unknown function (DUF4271)
MLWLAALSGSAEAQTPANPFDLEHRLARAATTPGDTSIATANPFDVAPHHTPGADSRTSILEAAPKNKGGLIPLPKGQHLSPSFLFWTLLLFSAFLVFSIAANRGAVGRAWRSFLSNNALIAAQREAAGLSGSTPYFLMYGSFLLNAALFAFLVTRAFTQGAYDNVPFFLTCVGLACFVFLSKHLILWVTSSLFPVASEVGRYNFLIIIFNCVLGLFLVPFNFLIALAGQAELFLASWALALAAIFYIYRAFRSFSIGSKFFSSHWLHFLLYLCVVEIAPVAILIKLFVRSTNT